MTEPLFSHRLDAAYKLAAIVHAKQMRKGTLIPYVAHPIHVASILARAGCSEDVVIAGVLHDVLEDGDEADLAMQNQLNLVFPGDGDADPSVAGSARSLETLIVRQFGDEVRRLVGAVTEVKTEAGKDRSWEVRKREQLEHLESADSNVTALKAADALHNAHSILADVSVSGAEVFRRFNAPPQGTLWFYREVSKIVSRALGPSHRLARDLNVAVNSMAKVVGDVLRRLPMTPIAPNCEAW